MKRFNSIITLALVAIVSTALTACNGFYGYYDENEDLSYSLEGTWEGNMGVYQDWSGRQIDATYTVINFQGDPYSYSSGTGYWIDYYSDAPQDYVANHIQWYVRNGVITIYFIEDSDYYGFDVYVEIADYYLRGNRFYGTMYDGDKSIDFDLIRTSAPNWYGYDYGYDYYDYGFYAKPNKQGTRATTPEQPKVPMRQFHTK